MNRIGKSDWRSALPRRISLIVSDFDGVMTDGKVMVAQDGTESVVCNRRDGWGLTMVKERGVPIVVLSTESNPVVAARCKKLSVPCYQNAKNKLETLKKIAEEYTIPLSETIYLGDDTNDLECIRHAGCGVAVADAHPEVLKHARIVLSRRGGEGAVRELCELVLAKLNGDRKRR